MLSNAAPLELWMVCRPFERWSIQIPAGFTETFVTEDHYWHAYEDHRSVSLTSMVVTDQRGPVAPRAILREALALLVGGPVDVVPPGLMGGAVIVDTTEPARASRALSGILAVHGRLLLVTVTSDDLDFARRVWMSIGGVPVTRYIPGRSLPR
jgi:hypothetical protein